MTDAFETVLPWVLIHEGGYVNHPKDPGGATNKGVTQRTYDRWRRLRKLPQRDVRSIEDAEVTAIYRQQYWDKVAGDDLPAGVDYAVFDFAVHSGPARAIKFLQRALGFTGDDVDGVLGIRTLSAVQAVNDRAALIQRLCEARLAWMKGLKTWSTFGKGWTRRVMGEHAGTQDDDNGVIDRATLLAAGVGGIEAPRQAAPGKASDDDRTATADAGAMLQTKEGLGVVASVVTAFFTTAANMPWWIGAPIALGLVAVAVAFAVRYARRKPS